MGHIKKVLAMGMLPRRSVTPNMMWTDLCENVHFHYRNIRFDFSEVEFARLRAAINHLGMAVEYCSNEYGYSEGDPNFLVQQKFEEAIIADSDYYPDRVTIEHQKDGTVHFHYRDLRLHWSEREFEIIAELFCQAQEDIDTGANKFPHADVTEKTRVEVNIDQIQPYDEGHRPLVFDKDHREGIEYCKGLIEEGKKIRPILVDTTGQRLDGFKRYFAHLESGLKTIECIIDPFGKMGGQHNQSMIDDDKTDWAPKVYKNKCSKCGTQAYPRTATTQILRWTCNACGAWNDNAVAEPEPVG